MKHNAYVLFNTVEEQYSSAPFFSPSDGAVVRDLLNNHNVSSTLRDWKIFCIGSYVLDEGYLETIPPREVSWSSYAPIETESKQISLEEYQKSADDVNKSQRIRSLQSQIAELQKE